MDYRRLTVSGLSIMLITISAPPHVRDMSLTVAHKLGFKLPDAALYSRSIGSGFEKHYAVAGLAFDDESKYVILTPALSYVAKVINLRHHQKGIITPSHYYRCLEARNDFVLPGVNIVLTTVKQPEDDDLWEWSECNHYAADVGAEVIYTDTLTTDQIVNQIILELLPKYED